MLLSVAVFCYMKLFSTVVCCTLLSLHSADSTESFSSHSLHRSACTLGCTELYVLSSLCLTLSVSCCCRFVPYWIQPPHWSHVDPHCASFHSGVDVVLGYSTLSCTLPTFTMHHIYSINRLLCLKRSRAAFHVLVLAGIVCGVYVLTQANTHKEILNPRLQGPLRPWRLPSKALLSMGRLLLNWPAGVG